jgi:hypothetical protein
MTKKQKRLLVRLRLTQADAASMSDRAIARELGVSQPFVGAQRRIVAPKQVATPFPVPAFANTAPPIRNARTVATRELCKWVADWARSESRGTPLAPGRALCDGDPFQ